MASDHQVVTFKTLIDHGNRNELQYFEITSASVVVDVADTAEATG